MNLENRIMNPRDTFAVKNEPKSLFCCSSRSYATEPALLFSNENIFSKSKVFFRN